MSVRAQNGSELERKCLSQAVFFDFGETLISCNTIMVLLCFTGLDVPWGCLKSMKKALRKKTPSKNILWGEKVQKSAPKWHPKVGMLSCGTSCVFFWLLVSLFLLSWVAFVAFLATTWPPKSVQEARQTLPDPLLERFLCQLGPKSCRYRPTRQRHKKLSPQRPEKKTGGRRSSPAGESIRRPLLAGEQVCWIEVVKFFPDFS